MKRLTALLLLALFSSAFLSACNTMEGVGEEFEQSAYLAVQR